MKILSIGTLAALVIAGILVAALWPFNPFPKNDVSWAQAGLRFGDYGTLFSSGDAVPPRSADGDCSLEIWLTPALTDDSNVILAYAPRDNPGQFRVGQTGNALYVGREVRRSGSVVARPYILIPRVFHQDTPILVTVAGGKHGTLVYINGKLAVSRDGFGLTASDFAGPMVVANSPVGNNSWAGLLQGIAVYGAQLPSQDVAGHYQLWSAGDTASLMRAEADVLYLFREGSGRNAHNSGRSQQPDLWIPDHYRILYPTFLHPFWKDFHMNRSKLQDMSNNVIAFIPLGFLTCCWFARKGQNPRAFWWAILFGTLLSLSLECIQYFLPMRDSDSMDWLTNTSGTIIGACLGALELRYNWLGKIPVIGSIWRSARLNSSQ